MHPDERYCTGNPEKPFSDAGGRKDRGAFKCLKKNGFPMNITLSTVVISFLSTTTFPFPNPPEVGERGKALVPIIHFTPINREKPKERRAGRKTDTSEATPRGGRLGGTRRVPPSDDLRTNSLPRRA
jgi:hypothetical protein